MSILFITLIGFLYIRAAFFKPIFEINTSGLPPGVYLVRVSDGNGNTVVQKILK